MTQKKHRKIPLLMAPAGNFKTARVALEEGADILYAGIRGWSLRPTAFEISEEEFLKILNLTTKYGKQLFLAMNCFYRTDEIPTALEIIEKMAGKGISAVIVSQPGLIREIHNRLPDLPIHVSVQTSVSNRQELELYKELGASVVVLPRNFPEVDPEHIRALSGTGIGLELFLIGDDSLNYDGRCFLSSYLNQRRIKDDTKRKYCMMGSANRNGFCYLMCKRDCKVTEPDGKILKGHVLRRGDLALFTRLSELADAGIQIVKIQGREFPTNLVRQMVRMTRKLLDSMDDEISRQKYIEELSHLVKLKQIIASNHLWLLAKSKNDFWRKIRPFIEKPWDTILTFVWFAFPLYRRYCWNRYLKKTIKN
ncbi:MAG: U32 family peptidase [Candidatus Eremiobacteraeota bacterium]|nr:U32 family peptidase [Candidatus Eremiobacteraeota bacterium]